jgi:DNA helicase-2/ATP-dependent DNA helicase PcrA
MECTKQDILNELNEEQQIPVLNYTGPQFLVAGPGSGKTRVLVSRTQYMLLDGINPYNILLFTFTNKAAKEIKIRISLAVGEETANKITTGTYHSFCCKLLRKYGEKIGFEKNFSIFDTEDSNKVIKKILKDTNIEEKVLISYISKQKHNLITPQIAMQNEINNQNGLSRYYDLYQQELKKQQAMDFDDLIFNTIQLLELNLDVLEEVNARYVYISSDESHDSSKADLRLIQLLSGEKQNVCFILDDNQSIYSFRGADLQSVLNIRNIFPNLKTYFLNQNYRSTKMIVEASKSLIAKNSNQIEKDIFTDNEEGDPVIYVQENDPTHEAIRIAKTIQLLKNKYNYSYKDIAILYRTGAQSRAVEEILLRYNIPYEILSGVNFYERKEIKDIISYLSVISNKYNTERFLRIINVPKRGIGEKTLEKILDETRKDIIPIDFIQACKNLIERNEIKGKAKNGLIDFIKIIENIESKINDLTVPELLGEIIKQTNYYEYIKEYEEESYEERVGNIVELTELSYDYLTIEDFLEQTTMERKNDEDEDDKVQLLTMHMSKGLEWDAVFVIGCNEGTCPHFRSLTFASAIEEERRLFYVAMTRAKKNLFLLRPKRIKQNGFYINAKPSRFISEINDKYMYINNSK